MQLFRPDVEECAGGRRVCGDLRRLGCVCRSHARADAGGPCLPGAGPAWVVGWPDFCLTGQRSGLQWAPPALPPFCWDWRWSAHLAWCWSWEQEPSDAGSPCLSPVRGPDAWQQLLFINFRSLCALWRSCAWERSVPPRGLGCLSHPFACSCKSHFHGAARWRCHLAFQRERNHTGLKSLQIGSVI